VIENDGGSVVEAFISGGAVWHGISIIVLVVVVKESIQKVVVGNLVLLLLLLPVRIAGSSIGGTREERVHVVVG
jgi:hypothetical protein